MSLINQMLRDLDARRGPASHAETAALQGLGLASGGADGQHVLLQRIGWGIGLILTGALIQQGYQIWSERQSNQNSLVMAVSEPPETPARRVVSTPPTAVPIRPAKKLAVPPAPETKQSHNDKHSAPVTEEPLVQVSVKTKQPQIVRKPLTPTQKAQRRFNRAQSLLKSGRIRDAAKDLRAALDLNPNLGQARLQLATLYLQQGRTDRARQLLESGYRMNPADPGITMAYIRLLAEQGAYRQALELMSTRLQQDSVSADTFALAAALYYRIENFDASASHYREALAKNPNQTVWWMGLGVSLEHNQQPAEALEAYRRSNTAALDTTLKSFVTGRIAALSGRTE